MNNNYDQIMREKLQGVESTPPTGLWSKIEAALPSAGSTAAFDQAVKGKLVDLVSNPPAGLWNSIGAAITGKIPFYKTAVFKWSAAAIILISSFIGWNILNENHKSVSTSTVKNTPIETPLNKALPDNYNTEINNSDNDVTLTDAKTPLIQKPTKANKGSSISKVDNSEIRTIPSSVQKITSQFATSKSLFNEKKVITTTSENVFVNVEHQNSISKIITPFKTIEIINLKTENITNQNSNIDSTTKENIPINVVAQEKQKLPQVEIAENNIQNQGNQKIENQAENKPNSKVKPGTLPRNPRSLNKYGIGINYSPSYIQTEINKINKQDFNIVFAFRNLSFIADLGLGVGISSEKNNATINYNHFEFIKTQFITDSLSFSYDPNTQTYTPVAVGHHEKVYDDVKYSYSSEVTTNYTYLNVPINVGYIKELKYFDVFAKGGINYSLIISKSEKGNFEPDENTTIISKDYTAKTRLNTSISYGLSCGGSFNLRNDLKFTGEIIGSYYQNPIYSEINYRPYSYGVRFGLIYYLK